MKLKKITAVGVGILFIIGTVAGILSVVLTGPILNSADYLLKISADQNKLISGALCILIMGFALAIVPVLLYPIFKKYNEVLALGYVVFRGALETVTYIMMAASWLLLIIVSQEYVKAGVLHGYYFKVLGDLLLKANVPISAITTIVFSLGALMLYYLFYRSKLIPRWISVWGFIAIILNLIIGFLIMFQQMSSFSTLNLIMSFPIFLQEMFMAIWLIVRGFNK